jgi:hypothetical protein
MKTIWQWIVAWAMSKGGWAHVVAGIWAFFLAAFTFNQPFHQFVLTVYDGMPRWLSGMIALAISLWGFYKTWKPMQNSKPPKP